MANINTRVADLTRNLVYGILTCAIVVYVWSFFEQIVESVPWLSEVTQNTGISNLPFLLSAAIIIVSTLVVVIVIGFIAQKLIWDRVAQMPIFASLTSSVDQVGKRLLSGKSELQDKVVWVQWPNDDLQTIGVITGKTIDENGNAEWLTVVMYPTAGKVTGGMLRRVRPAQVTSSNWSVNEALAFVSSSGAIGNTSAER